MANSSPTERQLWIPLTADGMNVREHIWGSLAQRRTSSQRTFQRAHLAEAPIVSRWWANQDAANQDAADEDAADEDAAKKDAGTVPRWLPEFTLHAR